MALYNVLVNSKKEIDSRSQKQIIEFMQKIQFFAQRDIDEQDYHTFALSMSYSFMPQGKIVFEAGSIGDNFYIILSGEVGVYINIPSDSDENAMASFYSSNRLKGKAFEESVLKLQGKYEFMKMNTGAAFGEIALITDQPRAATILCTQD